MHHIGLSRKRVLQVELSTHVRLQGSSRGRWAGLLTGTHRLQGVMAALQGGGQVSLRAASKQQEIIHILLIVCRQLFIGELHRDNAVTLQAEVDTKRKERSDYESSRCYTFHHIRNESNFQNTRTGKQSNIYLDLVVTIKQLWIYNRIYLGCVFVHFKNEILAPSKSSLPKSNITYSMFKFTLYLMHYIWDTSPFFGVQYKYKFPKSRDLLISQKPVCINAHQNGKYEPQSIAFEQFVIQKYV